MMATRARGRPSNAVVDNGWPWQVESVRAIGWTEALALGEWSETRVPPGDHERRSGRSRLNVGHALRTSERADASLAVIGGTTFGTSRRNEPKEVGSCRT